MSVDVPDGPRAGVTLVELVIVISLGGLVLLGLGYVFGLNSGLFLRGQARMVLNAGAARALEEIVRTAGHASGFAIPAEGELHVFSPASPVREDAASEPASETVFRLQDHRLFRNDEGLVPHPGDSSLGVAAFEPRLVSSEGAGVRTLEVRLSLFTRGTPTSPAETLHFETQAHARNAGLGRADPSGGIPGSGAGKSAGAGTSL